MNLVDAGNVPAIICANYATSCAYRAGMEAAWRDGWLSKARRSSYAGERRMMVKFARDCHHKYLSTLRRLRKDGV